MTVTVSLIESDARPTLCAREVEVGGVASAWLHPDVSDAEHALRATVLCGPGQHPPRGASLLLEVEVAPGGVRVQGVGTGVQIELQRAELRSRVTVGTQLRSPSRLEALMPDQRRIAFVLDVAAAGLTEVRSAVGAGGTRRSAALAANRGALWLVPSAWELFTDPDGVVIDNLTALGQRFGLSLRSTVWITLLWFTVGGAGWAFYNQRLKTSAAEEETAKVQGELELAESARGVALGAELSCLSERGALVEKLGELGAQRRLAAEVALGVSGAQGAAIELGGQRFGAPEVLAADEELRQSLLDEIVRQLEAPTEAGLVELGPCLAHDKVLGADLPRYALIWHPDPAVACPRTYASVEGGVSLVGRWGLSLRASREFGVEDPALTLALSASEGVDKDPRANDRWAVAATMEGLRAVQTALLRYQGAGRVPVAPSQAQIWSLALWSAYDTLPDPVSANALDGASAASCVDLLLDDLASAAGPAAAGRPLLPDLVAVTSGEVEVAASPIPACPWPTDAVREGATAALAAVVRLARAPDLPPSPTVESP